MWAFPVKWTSNICCRTFLMISPHWLMWWLGHYLNHCWPRNDIGIDTKAVIETIVSFSKCQITAVRERLLNLIAKCQISNGVVYLRTMIHGKKARDLWIAGVCSEPRHPNCTYTLNISSGTAEQHCVWSHFFIWTMEVLQGPVAHFVHNVFSSAKTYQNLKILSNLQISLCLLKSWGNMVLVM